MIDAYAALYRRLLNGGVDAVPADQTAHRLAY
jgi:hypothetical protein